MWRASNVRLRILYLIQWERQSFIGINFRTQTHKEAVYVFSSLLIFLLVLSPSPY